MMIVARQLEAGERLPGEPELAELFGVGRSTVREAIRALAADQLVDIVRGAGGGTFVRQPRFDDIAAKFSFGLELIAGSTDCTIDELVESRKLLELHSARVAAHRCTPTALEAIEASIPARGAEQLSSEQIFQANCAFHLAVVDAAGNRVITGLARSVLRALYPRVDRDVGARDTWARVNEEHRAIAAAIGAQDEDLAERLMLDHLACLKPVYSTMERGAARDGRPRGDAA